MSTPSDLASREAALALLQAVLRKRRSLDSAFDRAAHGLEVRDRAFVRMLVATCLRRLGQIDAVLGNFLTRLPPDAVYDALRLGVAQVLFLGTPAHASVATTVALVKAQSERLSGLSNAVMRRVAENGGAIIAAQDAARLNTPDWLWRSWTEAYGEPAARACAEVHLQEAPLDLSFKEAAGLADWASRLGANLLPTGGLRLASQGRIQDLAGFEDGAWWVQDAAAALPVRVLIHALGAPSGQNVADLCAAPGGKTAQLAAAGFRVTAVDVSKERLGLLRANLKRLKVDAGVVEADIQDWRPPALLDGVLLDAPCSATGTIRRHPDLPHLKQPGDIRGFVAQQNTLLAAAMEMVKPGGWLVYSVCSLQAEERRAVVDTALASRTAWSRVQIDRAAVGGENQFLTRDGDLRTLPSQWPERGGLDGFYAALLRRNA